MALLTESLSCFQEIPKNTQIPSEGFSVEVKRVMLGLQVPGHLKGGESKEKGGLKK